MTGFRLSGSGYMFRSLGFNLLSHFCTQLRGDTAI